MCSYISILCSLCVSGVVFFMWTQLDSLVQLQDYAGVVEVYS